MGFKYLIPILAVLLLVSSVSADHIEELGEPGVGPGNFFWGMDRMFESIKLMLTFDRETDVELRLQYAAERLAEANAAIEAGKPERAAKAIAKHQKILEKVEGKLAKVDEESVDGIYTALQAQSKALEHISENAEVENLDKAVTVLERVLERRGKPDQAADASDRADDRADEEADDSADDDSDGLTDDVEPDADEDESLDDITGAIVTDGDEVEENETVEESSGIAIDLTITATIDETGTQVAISGDLTDSFALDTDDEDEIIKEVAAELGMTESEVEDTIKIINNIGKPRITVLEEGGEIVRVTVLYEGIETKFVLGITDYDATVNEIWKRTGINQSIIDDVINWQKG